nr:MAG TPA: hypothetical protein [Caudoviricetes sp.]
MREFNHKNSQQKTEQIAKTTCSVKKLIYMFLMGSQLT